MAPTGIIVIVNHKGGTGKTTTAFHVAGFLAARGKRVLAVDLDPQANLTISFGIREDHLDLSIADVFSGVKGLPAVAIRDAAPRTDLVPSSTALTAGLALCPFPRKDEVLRNAVNKCFGVPYDFIIIDTPRADSILTTNGLLAAEYVLVPFHPDYYGITGVRQVFDIIADIQNRMLNSSLKTLGLVVTRYADTSTCRKVFEKIKSSKYGQYLCSTVIRESPSISASIAKGVTLAGLSSRFLGHRDYGALTDELLQRISRVHAL
jgi:chromosome partitioning protein